VVEILYVAATGRGGAADAEASMKPEDRDKACRLFVLVLLRNLLVATRKKVDVVTWRALGGLEAEDFLDALETGRRHPLLTKWEELKATVAVNRSAPSQPDQNTRHTAIVMAEALHRAGLGKEAARKRAAKAVQGVFPTTTKRTIKYWQSKYSITVDGEQLIARAIEHHGHDHDRLVDHFVAYIDFWDNPVAALEILRLNPDAPVGIQ
jgi:hypothetical protein